MELQDRQAWEEGMGKDKESKNWQGRDFLFLFAYAYTMHACMYVCICVYMHVCTYVCALYVPGTFGGQKIESHSLELALLQTVVSHHMGAGNQAWVLCKIIQCS